MTKMEKKMVNACAMIMKTLSNETRLNIILSLYERAMTWTELIFALKINPKSLRDHLRRLIASGFVKKSTPAGFELTEAARSFIELKLESLMLTAKIASQYAGRS